MELLNHLKEEINKKANINNIVESLYNKLINSHKYNKYCYCNWCKLTSDYIYYKRSLQKLNRLGECDFIINYDDSNIIHNNIKNKIKELKIERSKLKLI